MIYRPQNRRISNVECRRAVSLCSVFFIKPGYLERTSVLDLVGAASDSAELVAGSRDRFNSRLAFDKLRRGKAAPTGVFFSNLDLPDQRIPVYTGWNYDNHLRF